MKLWDTQPNLLFRSDVNNTQWNPGKGKTEENSTNWRNLLNQNSEYILIEKQEENSQNQPVWLYGSQEIYHWNKNFPEKIRRYIFISSSMIKRLRLKNMFTWEVAQLAELTRNVEIEVIIFSFWKHTCKSKRYLK